jgi:hypothetical protein
MNPFKKLMKKCTKNERKQEVLTPLEQTFMEFKQVIGKQVSDTKKIDKELGYFNEHLIQTALPHYKK